MTKPQRIQRLRARGWRMPVGASFVGRPTVFGNPFTIGDFLEAGRADDAAQARQQVVDAFRDWVTDPESLWWPAQDGEARRAALVELIPTLAERDLVCWCRLDLPCHADVLLALANPAEVTAAQIASTITEHRFRYCTEAELQQGIHAALASCGLPVRREVRLSSADIVDFMVGSVAIEIKVAGALGDVVRQLTRYARHDQVSDLVLVTTRAAHRAVPHDLAGTPVRTVWLSGEIG